MLKVVGRKRRSKRQKPRGSGGKGIIYDTRGPGRKKKRLRKPVSFGPSYQGSIKKLEHKKAMAGTERKLAPRLSDASRSKTRDLVGARMDAGLATKRNELASSAGRSFSSAGQAVNKRIAGRRKKRNRHRKPRGARNTGRIRY